MTWNEPASGLAGKLARAALTTYAIALALFAAYVVLVVARPGDWTALLFFGVGLVVTALAIVLLAAAVAAAALGQGRIPAWGLVAAALLFLAAGGVSSINLAITSSPWLLASVAAAGAVGTVAAIATLVRDLRQDRQGRGRRHEGGP